MTVDKQVGAVTSSESQMTLEEWLALRKEAALQIDPETAEVTSEWGPIGDPYEIYPPHPEENIGRRYFARSLTPFEIETGEFRGGHREHGSSDAPMVPMIFRQGADPFSRPRARDVAVEAVAGGKSHCHHLALGALTARH
jgi:hypothetical protein